jgi:hypothetical protein
MTDIVAASTLTVAQNVPPATIVSLLSLPNPKTGKPTPCAFSVADAHQLFANAGDALITMWDPDDSAPAPGNYTVHVVASAPDSGARLAATALIVNIVAALGGLTISLAPPPGAEPAASGGYIVRDAAGNTFQVQPAKVGPG